MRLPHRSISSIQPLPSIYTAFPPNYGGSQSTDTPGINSGTCLIKRIEDGIEAVPFERSNILSAPILSPDQEEKEVFVSSYQEIGVPEKPLPTLPRCMWHRMSRRQRILAVLGVQFLVLVTIGLSLLAVKRRSSTSDENSTVRVAGDGFPSTNTTSDIRRGIFALPVQLPQQQSTTCLASPNQTNAWQCASNSTFQISILPTPVDNDTTIMIAVRPPPSYDSVRHGERIPNIPPSKLLAIGNSKKEDDFAYHFRTFYDKVVLLSEDELSMPEELQLHHSTLNSSFKTGDILWQCVFNETLLDGYIYPNKITTASATRTASDVANAENFTGLPEFPYSIRLVEEWTPNDKSPYCRKMIMEPDGTLAPLLEEITLRLGNPESEDPNSTSQRVKSIGHRLRREEAQSSQCQCQWLVNG